MRQNLKWGLLACSLLSELVIVLLQTTLESVRNVSGISVHEESVSQLRDKGARDLSVCHIFKGGPVVHIEAPLTVIIPAVGGRAHHPGVICWHETHSLEGEGVIDVVYPRGELWCV